MDFQLAFGIDLNIDPLWCAWFSGLVDGEGCFYSYIDVDTRAICPAFEIRMRNDEQEYFKTIKDTLKCGIISGERSRGNHRAIIRYEVRALGACRNIIIPVLDQYPLKMKKQRDYKIWREIVMLVHSGQHLNGHRQYVIELCQQLKDIKTYHDPSVMIEAAAV